MIIYLGKKTTFVKIIKSLRKRGVDPDNNISDEYLINEAYSLGEWEYVC
jgi:hypothetical protein